ncbi:MAG: hypothetical protein NVSMB9_18860 [Isosphaeraceae bacterium]
MAVADSLNGEGLRGASSGLEKSPVDMAENGSGSEEKDGFMDEGEHEGRGVSSGKRHTEGPSGLEVANASDDVRWGGWTMKSWKWVKQS